MTKKSWETIEKKQMYKNPFLSFREDVVKDPNGNKTIRNFIDMGSSVVIIPKKNETFYLNKQARYAVDSESIEFPNGGIEENETLKDAALRELKEEQNLTPEKISKIGSFHILNSLIGGQVHVFVAEGVKERNSKGKSEKYEDIDRIKVKKSYLESMMKNQIKDSYTLSAYNKFKLRRK